MKLHHVMLSIVFISAIILAFIGPTGYISSLKQTYSQSADFEGLDETLEKINETNVGAHELYTDITNWTVSLNPLDIDDFIVYKSISIGLKASKVLFGSWSTLASILGDLGKELGKEGIVLPDWVIATVITIILISLVAMAIYAFFKWRFED